MNHARRALVAAVLGAASIAAAPIDLPPNRATYEVSLERSLPGGIVAVRGRTVMEMRRTCDGYQTTQRFLADMTDSQSSVSRSDFAVRTWESLSGETMRFDIDNMVDGTITERYKGSAHVGPDGGGSAVFSLPKGQSLALPAGTVFPTAQTIAIIRAAEAGAHSYSNTVFQGGGKNDLYQTSVTIGAPTGASKTDAAADGAATMLVPVRAWPVLVSYYPVGKDAETPSYEIAALLYADGIVGSMSLIYSRFTMRAVLTRIEKLPAPAC